MNWDKISNFLYRFLYDNQVSKTIIFTTLVVLISICVGLFVVWIVPDWAPAYGTVYKERIAIYFGIGAATIIVVALIIGAIVLTGELDLFD